MGNLKSTVIPEKHMRDTVTDNAFLFAITLAGAVILSIGYAPPYHDMQVALGAAFIIAGAVGIYMMLATRQVAKKLHERFNVQNGILENNTMILESHTKIMNKMDDSLRDIASSQKDIASSQKDTVEILKRIEDKL